jgi:hypothetical protein
MGAAGKSPMQFLTRAPWVFSAGLLVSGVISAGTPMTTSSKPEPSQAEQRMTLHRILDRATNQNDGIHDACGSLVTLGDASSVPHLIGALQFFPDEEIAGKSGVGIVCTQSHCVDALERITGAKVGVSYSSWRQWWNRTHPGQPLQRPHNSALQPSDSSGTPPAKQASRQPAGG